MKAHILISTHALKIDTDGPPQSSRQAWLWIQGIALITLVHHHWKDLPSLKIKTILIQHDCYPHNYHYSKLNSPFTVYMKLFPSHGVLAQSPGDPKTIYQQLYFGSAKNGMLPRDHSRASKFRQLLLGILCKCELALRHWHHHNNYHKFLTIVLTLAESHTMALSKEHTNAATHNSTLNYPILDRTILKKATGFKKVQVVQKHRYHLTHRRLFHKYRKRFKLSLKKLDLESSFHILFQLSSQTKDHFEAQKALRSYRYSVQDLYLLWRVSQNIEQPHRSMAQNELKSALSYKNHTPPPINIAPKLPLLAHPEFKRAVASFLRKQFITPHNQLSPLSTSQPPKLEKSHTQPLPTPFSIPNNG